jgi:hypothetical protein
VITIALLFGAALGGDPYVAKGGPVLEYIELESLKEICRLNNVLSATLKDALPYKEVRSIGYPGGAALRQEVWFRSDPGTGNAVFYWTPWLPPKDNSQVGNLFGHGTPGSSNDQLNIDVEFDFSVVEFTRRKGGAFLQHVSTKKCFLAHRGIMTLVHSRIPKADLFSKMAKWVREAKTGNHTNKLLVIDDEFESLTFIESIDEFSSKVRQIKEQMRTV